MSTRLRLVIAIGLALFVTGCVQGIAVKGEFPAAYPNVAKLNRIVVYPFRGRDGAQFTSTLTADLQTAEVNGKPHFTIVTPRGRDIRRSLSSAGLAARYGRRAGVEAVYYGTVNNVDFGRSRHMEQRQQCVKSKGLFKCLQWRQYTVTCYNWKVRYSAVPKVVDVATGVIVYSKVVTAARQYGYCSDQQAQVTPGQLIEQARNAVANEIRHNVAPYNATFRVQLKEKAPLLADKDQAVFDGAVKFAKAGRMDRACAIWQGLAPTGHSKSVSVLYDLGVCAEAEANYERAYQLYGRADSALMAPDDLISAAVKRAKGLERGQAKID